MKLEILIIDANVLIDFCTAEPSAELFEPTRSWREARFLTLTRFRSAVGGPIA